MARYGAFFEVGRLTGDWSVGVSTVLVSATRMLNPETPRQHG